MGRSKQRRGEVEGVGGGGVAATLATRMQDSVTQMQDLDEAICSPRRVRGRDGWSCAREDSDGLGV